ncbi:MAG TPA: hypothetical protein PKE00_05960 [Planctomycetota bacterium]|nr:hypothetical protein [Planctomycetota bacterium]
MTLIVATAADLSAQSCVYLPANQPGSGASSTVPFGSSTADNHFVQYIVPQSVLGNTKREILGIAFAPAASALREINELTITLRQTPKNTLTTDRLGAVVGFSSTAQYGRVHWPVQGNQWNRLPIRYPYDPVNGNLLIEIWCVGAKAQGAGDLGFRQDAATQVLTASGWGFQPPRQCTLGMGAPRVEVCFDAAFFTVFSDSACVGSNQKMPQISFTGSSRLGQTANVDLAGASGASGLAVLIWGFRHLAGVGVDLTAAGAPGCFLRMRIDFVFGFATTNGAARAPIPIPNSSSLIGIDPLGCQWFTFDPTANALQFVSSNWGFVNIGS